MPSANVTGINVNLVTSQDAVKEIIDAAHSHTAFGVALLAVHPMASSLRDPDFRFRVNHMNLRLADGMPVLMLAKYFARSGGYSRIRGHNLMQAVLRAAAREQLSVYLFGGRAESLDLLKTSLPDRYPGIRIAGTKAGRFEILSDEENARNVQELADSRADVIFVGLGSPRQETWIFENQQKLNCPLLAIGAAFDYESGLLQPPPQFVQEIGMEWFWRLCRDPKRLWRRYFISGPVFFFFAFLQMIRVFEIRDRGTEPKKRINYG